MLGRTRRRTDGPRRRFRRGVYLLPSLMTLGNLFCGYACIVYAMRSEYAMAAPFIGIALVLDGLDGRIARMTGTASAFGLEFDSLADMVSFGMAPAILTFSWGLTPLGRWGWAAGFIYITATAMRLARFNIQSGGDKRYFAGMPSPAAATVPATTILAFPTGLHNEHEALLALALMLVPAVLMVSTIRFRSFKTIDLQVRRSYTVLILLAFAIAAVFAHPPVVLAIVSYAYLMSAFVELIVGRLRHRGGQPLPVAGEPEAPLSQVVEEHPRI
jgi:CDP-diacylglycerol---serine O-phosphatidyltransferase